jgi:hypothetical protein
MKPSGDRFEQVMALARKADRPRTGVNPEAVEPLPLGFSTRVAALWASRPVPNEWDLWDRVSRWGLGLALAVCVGAFLFRGSEPEPPPTPFDQWVMGPVEGGRS